MITEPRLPAENVSMTLEVPTANGDEPAHHHLDVSLAYLPNGMLYEIAFTGRGKAGHGLDPLLSDLGIKLSRAIQGRDPDTGDERRK
jgi:hypothetical protein